MGKSVFVNKNRLDAREKLLRYIEAKNTALVYQTVRKYYECITIFLCLVSIGYMSNSLGLLYMLIALCSVFKFGIEVITLTASFVIMIQYVLALINLTDSSSPLGFPTELNENLKPGMVGIPVDNLAKNPNFAYDSWVYSMDDSQLVGIWFGFTLLLMLSYYMRVYKLPFNALMIPHLTDYAVEEIQKDRD